MDGLGSDGVHKTTGNIDMVHAKNRMESHTTQSQTVPVKDADGKIVPHRIYIAKLLPQNSRSLIGEFKSVVPHSPQDDDKYVYLEKGQKIKVEVPLPYPTDKRVILYLDG